jgi:hypothetical protein
MAKKKERAPRADDRSAGERRTRPARSAYQRGTPKKRDAEIGARIASVVREGEKLRREIEKRIAKGVRPRKKR